MSSRAIGALGAVIVLLGLASCGNEAPAAAGAPCSTSEELLQAPTNPILVYGDVLVPINSFADLKAASSHVVVGKVQTAEAAEFFPDGPDGEGLQMEHLNVDVLQVLSGTIESGSQVVVRQAGLEHGRIPIFDGLRPARVGECAVFFLMPSTGRPSVWITSSQGRYAIDNAGRLVGAEADPEAAPAVPKVESMTLSELSAALQTK